jgi:pimeloyl-ACP methyl ester carboxylesterase
VATVKVNGVELFYKETGSGEAIVFSHGLLLDHSMFEAQRAILERNFRVIAYDHRGQGQSEDTGNGQDMDTLSTDAAGLIQALNAAPCHFVGLSMGGFIGLRLAARRPALIRSLTVMNTSAGREPWPSRLRFSFLAQLVRLVGPSPFSGIAMQELFGETTRRAPEQQSMLNEWQSRIRKRSRNAAEALLAVANRSEVTDDELLAIQCPTLIIAGEEDTARPPRDSEYLKNVIPGSSLLIIPGCGHSSTLEHPEAVTTAMMNILGAPRTMSQGAVAN